MCSRIMGKKKRKMQFRGVSKTGEDTYKVTFRMGKKRRIMITIDEDTLKKAKEMGLNISKTCDYLLKRRIELLKREESGTNPKRMSETSSNPLVRGVGSPPKFTSKIFTSSTLGVLD